MSSFHLASPAFNFPLLYKPGGRCVLGPFTDLISRLWHSEHTGRIYRSCSIVSHHFNCWIVNFKVFFTVDVHLCCYLP